MLGLLGNFCHVNESRQAGQSNVSASLVTQDMG